MSVCFYNLFKSYKCVEAKNMHILCLILNKKYLKQNSKLTKTHLNNFNIFIINKKCKHNTNTIFIHVKY